MFEPTAIARCPVRDDDGASCSRTPGGAPFGLCHVHAAVVLEWGEAEMGREDLLLSPCIVCGSRTGVKRPSGWTCAVCEWRVGEVVDGELPPPRVDVVYYIRFDDRIKIGTTANPRQRLQRLWHEGVLAFERGDRLVERRRHEQFASDRLGRSEWFSPSAALEHHIAELAAGVEDPWLRHARWVSEAIAVRG